MDSVKLDRRTRKTKTILHKTLIRLLQEKELKDISVSELTELADVNRGTFYLHYKDIYDLFAQVENEALEEFTGVIMKFKQQEPLTWAAIIPDLFAYISTHAETFMAILKTRESSFLTNIIELNRPKSREEWRWLFPTGQEEYYGYYYDFFTSGCVALVRSWFKRGMPESSEQMGALAEKLMTNCIRDLS